MSNAKTLDAVQNKLCLVKFDYTYFLKSQEWLSDPYIKGMIRAVDSSLEARLKWFESLEGRGDFQIWGVQAGDRPIGVGGIKNIKDGTGEYFGYIGEADCRGKGLGKEMMQLILNKARESGMRKIRLKVLHKNIPALSLYIKSGFTETQIDEEFLYMEKQL